MNDDLESRDTERTGSRVLRALPGLLVIGRYRTRNLAPDMLSGLVICLVVVPSVLAYAELAGSTPMGGIFSALAATVGYFLFASSRHMNVGPDGAVALLAGVAIMPIVAGDPSKGVIAGAWLALFTGAILLVAAKLRLGVVASFLSTPVLLGYLNGAAVVIIVSQWGKLFGIDLENESLWKRFIEWIDKLPETHMETLYTAVAVLILLFIFKLLIKRIPPLVPVFFIAMVCGIFVDFETMGVGVIGELRSRIPESVGLTLDLEDIATLAVGALGLSMLIFPEGVLLGRAMAEKHRYDVDADQELLALGSANVLSGLMSGFTVGGSQTRTLLNSASGGRTQVANLASALYLVLFVVFASQWLADLPKVAIAAILVFTGFGLIDIKSLREMWGRHRATGAIAIATTAAVVFIGVLPGILLGTAASIAILLSELARPHDALLGQQPGSDELHDVGDDEKAEGIPGLVVYRFYAPLVFANVSYFIERLQTFIAQEDHPVKQVVIDARAIPSIDFTAAEKLRPFLERLHEQGIEVAVARAHLPLREVGMAAELGRLLPRDRIFRQVGDAVDAFKARHQVEG